METRTRSKEPVYARRINRVLAYIDKHLYEDLTVDVLSDVANFSKFHFHRQFSQHCGISLSRYIQFMRLKRAAYRLAFNPTAPITDVALDSGFENPESFSRAFKAAFGQTPSAFRKKPDWASWSARSRISLPLSERTNDMDVKIIDVEPILVAALEHRGAPALLNDSVQRFIAWRKSSGLSPVSQCETYGVPYNDPNTTPPEEFRFDICGSVTEPVAGNEQGVVTKTIPGGRCAMTVHAGSRDRIDESVYALYRHWLPESGEELRDFPVYFHYLNLDHDTPEHRHLTEIYLPLK
ncbi:AraC family transcriptional regulator [Methylocystis sp. B8]|uniref:AraC family transcriptional regulator n=1 Tax=Methylocystis sp. B8 TaxID=544938 RepID=UPI0010FECF91|nr:AraC family transcriptional regulator [Methylocystis sp. B8]TLG78634.1 helix-turn-helix domain-containing protein [Methylocystis sp. B8]